MSKKVITERDVNDALKKGLKSLEIPENALITPLAADRIKITGIGVVKAAPAPVHSHISFADDEAKGVVSVGCDHNGFQIKQVLMQMLKDSGFVVKDEGCYDSSPADYPEIAFRVAKAVSAGEAAFGVVIDATGNASAIVANKIKGVRAAVCYNEFTADSARSHNNSNLLALGAKSLGEETIKSVLKTFINTPYQGGRHQKRLDMMLKIENNSLK
ncbi:MAG: RpiB/LacA/LacB family sugar-phosphate isomerase [Ignavibacteriaceae bacterium]|nr:RpiB/LacA/LacB family sugar-phosphate isomerase [Ignavibacteriaceae bacterium]